MERRARPLPMAKLIQGHRDFRKVRRQEDRERGG